MEPYFVTNHLAGVLITTTTAAWGMMELAQRTNGPQREGATRVGGARHRIVVLAAANWAGLAALMLLVITPLLVRIHNEENALLVTLGDRYRAYATTHKRLVPLVW
jgi:protein-S-isoprenylcysteine O-methyltransferase Ste14